MDPKEKLEEGPSQKKKEFPTSILAPNQPPPVRVFMRHARHPGAKLERPVDRPLSRPGSRDAHGFAYVPGWWEGRGRLKFWAERPADLDVLDLYRMRKLETVPLG